MKRLLLFMAAGAALAYFFDPDNGPARRNRANAWLQENMNGDTWQQMRANVTTQAQNLGQRVNELRSTAQNSLSSISSGARSGSNSSNSSNSSLSGVDSYSTPAGV